ncbi:alkyl/aryl-sulfatase [Streptomyces sp. NBC_00316]|uniref:alkyl/aryl-sulfatase n=1 Tax=Streptomyces sp. NBC_00316 TaxID=2975710 RepID=UPI002E2A3ADC|nr:alkyl sulfatase dimerization domain-containing protein [Streptomyces sp. NBC_00316]
MPTTTASAGSTAPDFADRTDFENADRGFVAGPSVTAITGDDGRVVWDFADTAFLEGDCPDTVNPSLWRQAQLCARAGLYRVTDGIYQIRGFDLSNMTLIEGDTGVIVVDPLVSAETAAAGLALYLEQRGDRPVTGVLLTHSHIDHFGGIHGVVGRDDDVPVLAPQGFMQHSVTENVYAGTAMLRRGAYYSGMNLGRGPTGLVGTGLGFTASTGTTGILPPTIEITGTGQVETVDGVVFHFQLTPGTEAPAEMNFHLPEHRALCMAENATHNLHNILTLRGAVVRDARIWSRHLNEAVELFGTESDVLFASHHWPTWGTKQLTTFLSEQCDLYAYLHDQTLRLANRGHTGLEIAELIELPPGLARSWHARGYYGSVSHNVKAIYQRYLGWYDGHPSSLWEHPPTESARRYVDCMGGVDAVVARAGQYVSEGDLRFAAQLLKHAVFADPGHTAAKELLAQTFERLAHGAENATWRNCYLMGALELRQGITRTPLSAGGMTAALSVEQIFDSLAIRIDGPQAWDHRATLDWHFTDLGEWYRTTLRNGVLVPARTDPTDTAIDAPADVTFTLTRAQLLQLLAGKGLDTIEHTGDIGALRTLVSVLDTTDPDFAVVTP